MRLKKCTMLLGMLLVAVMLTGCTLPIRKQYAVASTAFNATLRIAMEAHEAGEFTEPQLQKLQRLAGMAHKALEAMKEAVLDGTDDAVVETYLDMSQ